MILNLTFVLVSLDRFMMNKINFSRAELYIKNRIIKQNYRKLKINIYNIYIFWEKTVRTIYVHIK